MTPAVTMKISLVGFALMVAGCGGVDSSSTPAQDSTSNARTQDSPSATGAKPPAETKAIQNVE